MRQAAECIALGDRVSRCVRSDGRWNLLVDQAMLSAAIPATLMDGHGGQVQFPAWLGRYSTAQKRQRMARQLAVHTHYRH
jgi:replication factor C subunit 1